MSIRLMTAVFAQPVDAFDNVAQRLIMVALADSANDDGACWPLEATLAERCGMSEIHCRRSLAALRKAGWFNRERTRKDDGHYGRNHYWLDTEMLTATDRPVSVPTDRGVSMTTDARRAMDHRSSAIGQEQPSGKPEPSLEPSRAPQAKRTRKPKADKAVKEPTVMEARKAQAREIIAAWWEFYEKRHGKKPMGNYHGAVNAVVAALAAGHQVPHIKVALAGLGSSAVTVFGLERALAVGTMPPRSNGQSARQAEQLEAIMNA